MLYRFLRSRKSPAIYNFWRVSFLNQKWILNTLVLNPGISTLSWNYGEIVMPGLKELPDPGEAGEVLWSVTSHGGFRINLNGNLNSNTDHVPFDFDNTASPYSDISEILVRFWKQDKKANKRGRKRLLTNICRIVYGGNLEEPLPD